MMTCGADPFGDDLIDDDLGLSRECRKIIDLLKENPQFKEDLINLASTVNEDHENAIGLYENGSSFSATGTSNQTQVELGDDPPHKIKTLAHTHNEHQSDSTNINTYSVFSIGYLSYMAKRLKEYELDNDFVAFLATGKGTYYALTINSKSKFKSFFKYLYMYDKWLNGESTSQEDMNYYNNTVKPLFEKYYDKPAPNPAPININNINNDLVVAEFLRFLDEGDLGLTLFETNTNFDNFDRLKLHDNQVEKENCSN